MLRIMLAVSAPLMRLDVETGIFIDISVIRSSYREISLYSRFVT